MAKKGFQNTSSSKSNAPFKGMVKDFYDSYYPEGCWSHAVNASNYTKEGDIGTLSNENANTFCASSPYPMIGRIYLFDQKWIIFSTDSVDHHEIGLFDEERCTYCGIVRDPCLNFSQFHLITGISKKNFDCTWQIYFADGNNFDRSVNIGNPDTWTCPSQPLSTATVLGYNWSGVHYIQECTTEPATNINSGIGCEECVDTLDLDCNKIRLSRLINSPCANIAKGLSGGSMPNGSYYVVIAYSINQQRVTDYFTPSNVQPLFAHQNVAGSLDVTFTNLDTTYFEEFELVVVSTISQQTTARQVGFYSTNTGSVSLDSIDLTTPSIPLEQIVHRSPVYAVSDKISQVSDYMLRISPTTRFDFNYQPLANRIQARWVAVEYPTNYYKNGGSNTSYLRDEVYAFWIRWVYDTGEKSSSYHIPGRPPESNISENLKCGPLDSDPDDSGNQPFGDLSVAPVNADNIELQYPEPNDYIPKFFELYNTGYILPGLTPIPEPLEDGGIIVGRGKMGYWQSTETYPQKPEIWNTDAHAWSNGECFNQVEVNLCGEYIRHHKMPDNKCVPHIKSYANNLGPGIYPDTEKIVLLGVEFENIHYPVDNEGKGIPGIVGYEILRGSREGNKSIIAKGIFNNLRENEMDTPPYNTPQPIDRRKGLYQNYPYNPLNSDPSLIEYEAYPGSDGADAANYTYYKYSDVKTDMYTFHSPDTQFRQPFLGETEVKFYGEVFGDVFGNFNTVPDHPKHKMITDFGFIVATIAGIGIAAVSIAGKRTLRSKSGYALNLGAAGAGVIAPIDGGVMGASIAGINAGVIGGMAATEAALVTALIPQAFYQGIGATLTNTNPAFLGSVGGSYDIDNESSPTVYSPANGAVAFPYHWATGTDSVIKLIEAFLTYEQYALMYTSHGNYSVYDPGLACAPGQQRRMISSLFYLDDNIQNIVRVATNDKYIINNLNRNKCVVVELNNSIFPVNKFQGEFINHTHSTVGTCLYNASVDKIYADNTVQTIGTVSGREATIYPADPLGMNNTSTWYTEPSRQFRTNTVVPYGALKYRNRNQYGQLELVRQIPATSCVINLDPLPTTADMDNFSIDNQKDMCSFPAYNSGLIFGGDTYIGRYTEKNKFLYFSEWLNKMPDGTPLDYTLHYMVKYAKYWGDFTGFDMSTFFNGITGPVSPPGSTAAPAGQILPNDFHNFDRMPAGDIFSVTNAYFYLFQCGVRDFFVESEINVDLRDWGNEPFEKIYNPYSFTDLKALFHPDIIKYDNYYKYDYSLSVSRIYNNFISWGAMHPRYYDPNVAELCYQYYPNRVLYSLPANLESIKDNWYAFLANNYKDFTSKITAIKNIGKNGAGIFFKNQSPVMFQGVDTLETDLGTKVTIGDGGLFSQPLQNLSNADLSYEYGACQDSLAIVNTPVGIFYMSAAQGKVFKSDGASLIPISDQYMKWWFNMFLPYFLLQDFPDFSVLDNPVAGIGCQIIYDNIVSQVYFCKRDFKLRKDLPEGTEVTYSGGTGFLVNRVLKIELGDPNYFEDASWTLSYDPDANDGAGAWISFHDWHPNHNIPGRTYFLTVLNNVPWLPVNDTRQNGFWKHNFTASFFNNYYARNFRYEIEWAMETDDVVNTLRNVMYQMECFIYDDNIQYDKYNVLDYNFDHAVIYNIEQVSGVLNLVLAPKNDVFGRAQYPVINTNSIDILFTKEEQKYRFNTFWDITDDRGEFTYPTVQRRIFDTAANGYDMVLNVNNLNYTKDAFQRKKFRHYTNFVKLYTKVDQSRPQNVNMLFKLITTNNLLSSR